MANESLMVGIVIAFTLYLAYKFLMNKTPVSTEFEKVYDKVLTSEEYKVKGQYDK